MSKPSPSLSLIVVQYDVNSSLGSRCTAALRVEHQEDFQVLEVQEDFLVPADFLGRADQEVPPVMMMDQLLRRLTKPSNSFRRYSFPGLRIQAVVGLID